MAESMQGLHRTCRCAEVTKEMIGKEVVLMGWVQKARDKGGIIFVDLRDRSGIMQLIFENGSIDEEGFAKAASKFNMIAQIENMHKQRFEYYAQLMRNGNLFKSEKTERWMCLNCGHIHESSEAPIVCPVCGVRQGYFIRENEAPFTSGGAVCQD